MLLSCWPTALQNWHTEVHKLEFSVLTHELTIVYTAKGLSEDSPLFCNYLQRSFATSTICSALRPNCFSRATAGPE